MGANREHLTHLAWIWTDKWPVTYYLINQVRGPYWENIGPWSWQYGPSAVRSLQKRPRTDILPVRSRASLVNMRFITRLKKAKTCKDTSAGSFGTMPGPILREYWTGNRAFWLVDFSYWPSDCLSRVITFVTGRRWCRSLAKVTKRVKTEKSKLFNNYSLKSRWIVAQYTQIEKLTSQFMRGKRFRLAHALFTR